MTRMRPAPIALAAATAVRPMLPAPRIATVSPDFRSPRLMPWIETASGSTSAPSCQDRFSRRGKHPAASLVMYWAKAPPLSGVLSTQERYWPVRQYQHCWQARPNPIVSTATRRPTAVGSTPSPTATISPVTSWPAGMVSASVRPAFMSRSEPQMPAARTLTSASPGPATGAGI